MKNIIFIALLLFIVSCAPKVDYSPRKINFDRDICVNCLMGLADQKYSVQAINSHNEVIWFDDIGCLEEYMKKDDWKKWKANEKVQIWVGDCQTGEWIDAQKAFYRFGDRTPMGYGYGALKEKQDSTYTFDELIQRIDKGLTKREEFIKQKKMLHMSKDSTATTMKDSINK